MVLFPLFDYEILELYGTISKFPKESLIAKLEEDLYLLLAVLPADEVVVISPSFLFENIICEEILKNNVEFLQECFIAIFMKENDLDEFCCKKQERYKRVANHTKYKDAYYKNRLKELSNLPFAKENKSLSIGTTSFSLCISQLEKERKRYDIPSPLFNEFISRLRETETTSFLWESVYELVEKEKISSDIVRKLQVRAIMSQSYLKAYQKEGIMLANDKLLGSVNFGGASTYDLIKIKRIFNALEISDMIIMMSCKDFCELKKNGDYMLAIKKVYDLLQSGKTSEDILQELRKGKVDRELQSIIKSHKFCGKKGYDMVMEKKTQKGIDVLIMIATGEEENAIIKQSKWTRERISTGQEYFSYEKNGIFFALARGYDMGEADAGIMAQKFIDDLKPKVIAMAGFCAGRKGKVHLGDVIVANKVYSYDNGKQISETESLPEISQYSLRGDWQQFIERLDEKWMENIAIQAPRDFEQQEIELLNELLDTNSVVAKELYASGNYPDWKEVIKSLRDQEYISITGKLLKLTKKGQKYIEEYIVMNMASNTYETKLHIGPIATGTKVQVWSKIFNILERKHDRKTCAIDMEAHAIGKLSDINEIPFIVVKGVGDFADDGKAFANRYIEYASSASFQFIVDLFSREDFMFYWNRAK